MGNNQGNTKSNHQVGNKSSGRHDANSSGTPAPSQKAPQGGAEGSGDDKNRSPQSNPDATSKK